MGAVFKAYDRELDRYVALKVIRADLMSNSEILQRFKQELLLASRISHKHILRIHDLGDAGGVKFISMAYIEGEDLASRIQREKMLPLATALTYAKQLCQALAAAHREGVVHRDLKPQNILIDRSDSVYVSDFGLAKSLEYDALAATAMTSAGQVLGTPRYMSPEQVEAGPIDGRTDIYSFGLILYEMVTGDLPFQGNSLQLMLGRVQSMPRNPSLLNSKLPPYLAGIIMRCLEKDVERRYQNFSDVLTDLEAQRCTPSGKKPKRSTTPTAKPAAILAIVALVCIAVLALVLRRYVPSWTERANQPVNTVPQMSGKHLAVVPLRIVGDDPKLSEAATGVVEALDARLFHVPGMTVVAPAAAAKSKPADPPQKLGHDLGANLLLMGTVQGSGDKVRFDLNLWDGNRNAIVWTKEISGLNGDLLTLEDEIYNDVTKALGLTLSPDAIVVAHPTENVGAYDLYLRAQTIMKGEQDVAHVQSAMDLFKQAVQADPKFALAYAGLANADVAMYRKKKDANWANDAVTAARQGEQLDPQLADVHYALGTAYSVIGRSAEAIDEIKQAIQLLPNSDEGYRRLGSAYDSAGNVAQAIDAYKKAIEINPYYWMNYNELGSTDFASGDYEGAVAAFRKVVEIEPDNGFGYGNLGGAALLAGKFQDSVGPLEKALKIAPTASRYSNLGTAYYYLQEYDLSASLFEKAIQLAPTSWLYTGNLADANRQAGKKEIAAGLYDKAIGLGKRELEVNPRNALTMGGMALWYARKGELQPAKRLIDAARSIDPNSVDLMYFQAQIADANHDQAAALAGLRQAFEKGLRPAIAVAEPDLRDLRSDANFQKLVHQFSHS